jgi:hypothetical protein
MLNRLASAALSRHHPPKHVLRVLDDLIGTWLTSSQAGRAIVADLGVPLLDAIVGVRRMVIAGELVIRKESTRPGGRFLLAIEPRHRAPRTLPGLPGGEALL